MADTASGGEADRFELAASDVDEAVTWTLTRAARNVERRLTAVIAEHGLSAVQFGVLAQLATHGSLTRAELARACFTSPQSMSGVIDGMVEKGMLELAGSGGRGRPNPVTLTERGREAIEAAWPAHVEANRAVHLGLTAAEARTLNAILHRLIEL